jgi:hypothetical protein
MTLSSTPQASFSAIARFGTARPSWGALTNFPNMHSHVTEGLCADATRIMIAARLPLLVDKSPQTRYSYAGYTMPGPPRRRCLLRRCCSLGPRMWRSTGSYGLIRQRRLLPRQGPALRARRSWLRPVGMQTLTLQQKQQSCIISTTIYHHRHIIAISSPS